MDLTRLVLAVSVVVLAGCSGVAQRPSDEPQIQPGSNSPQTITISRNQVVPVASPLHHRLMLRGGTQWRYIGSLSEGAVYKPVDTVLTLQERGHAYEAYLVVRDGMLVGYYLPVERTISPVENGARLDVTAQ